ncbi:unnamed protein product [Medioppia subpectinata]|uniref:Peptidase S54 rhomboid domain-containing protein n=1 Tax=Medioppia subpectinata TaxID=1979941 RepID=A0A7R9KL12_9ACAR|nr:unnamed protein product [Medioppia subpectinata]CAG2105595.1 unnamed protein product [Medioppia subpectinata]
MKDIEKLTGWARMATIYLTSGFTGYLASAVFLPFRPEVGPAGSLYGVMAYFFVELYQMWKILEKPYFVLAKQLAVALVLLFLGFLPWIDNYAHVTGFVIGGLLSLALIPSNMTAETRTKHIVIKICCFAAVLLIIITLFVLLYNVPIYDSKIFKYFNCIPFTSDWCANQDIQVNRIDIL